MIVHRAVTRALGGLVLVLVLGACGVPADDGARLTPPAAVPFDLLEATTTTLASGSGGGQDTICLAIDGSLLAVGRNRGGEDPLDSLLSLVLAGPTEGEANLGLRTSLDGEDAVVGIDTDGATALVELGEDVVDLAADQQLLALAQITCTLTAQPGITRMRFLLDDERIEVPVQGGALVSRPVTRADYSRLIAN